MPDRARVALLTVLFLCFMGSTPVVAQTLVRVLLAVAPEAKIVAEGAHSGSIDGIPAFRAPLGLSWPVSLAGGQLVIDGRPVGRNFLLDGRGAPLDFGGHRYRGSLRLVATDTGIEVINLVDIEDYLRGVVPAEMAASWPMEALKAQAVAARSYTLTSLEPSQDYDLCATVDCQVYRGIDAEHPRSDQAVLETRGIIVGYGDRPARTYYHADSGGVVASAQEVWGTPLPYLVAHPDVRSSSPHASWQARIDPAAVGASIAGLGLSVGRVTSLRVVTLTESGRVADLEVHGDAGNVELNGVQLTRLARSWGLKSTRFRMTGPFTVKGEGWGHGVGMSQYGARALAASDYDYAQILAYYYPHTALVRAVSRQASAP